MIKYIKKNVGILICAVLLLTGCGTRSALPQVEASLTICAEETDSTYVSNYVDMGITPNYFPVSDSFFLTSEFLYFADRAGAEGQNICRVALSGEEQPQELPIDLEETVIWALTGNEETEEIYFIGYDNGTVLMAAYHISGEKVWLRSMEEDEAAALIENMITKLLCDNDGRFYAFSNRKIFLFDERGVYQGEISCPEKQFIDICVCDNGSVYATYEGEGKYVLLAEIDAGSKSLSEGRDILGNGKLYPGMENTMLLSDDTFVYSCNPETEQIVKLYDFAKQGMLSNRIQQLEQMPTGEILAVTWELLQQDKPVELCITALGTMQENEKQQVTLMCFNVLNSWDELVFEFNKQSTDYEVVIDSIPLNDDYEKYINTRLLAKDSPDLIQLLDYKELAKYQEKDMFENLYPYLERSEKLGKDIFIEEVISCLEVEDGLYGLAKIFSVSTLMGKEADLGTEPGWTVEEFLNWLQENPQAKAQGGLSKETILEFCLKGNLEAYVDLHKQETDNDSLKELLQSIGELTTDEREYWDNWTELLSGDDIIIEETIVSGFYNHGNYQREDWVYKGYPTADGTVCNYINMACLSMLSNSKCKDGAYAFMEYYLTESMYADNCFDTQSEIYAGLGEAALEKKMWLQDVSKEVPAITEKLLKKQQELFTYAVPDNYHNSIIRSIIIEEASAYFQGAKDLDATCDIISNRVQLYIDENDL